MFSEAGTQPRNAGSPTARSSARYVASRLLQGLLVVFGATTISFVLFGIIGSPVDAIGGLNISPEQRAQLARSLDFDRPAVERYLDYVGGVAHGNFGRVYRTGEPAIRPVLHAMPYTAMLVAADIALALAIAIPVALFSVLHRESRADRIIRRVVSALQGIPEFFLGLMLIIVFSVGLQAFPSFGYSGPLSLVLPAITLAVPLCPSFVRILRGQLLDVVEQEFTLGLRSRGLAERYILTRHALRNVLVPSTSILALQIGWLLGGTIIVEDVFSWPGMGSLLVNSVQTKEYNIISAIVILVAIGYVLLNLLADLIALRVDPRIRLTRA